MCRSRGWGWFVNIVIDIHRVTLYIVFIVDNQKLDASFTCQTGSMKQIMIKDTCHNSPVSYLNILLLCWIIACNQNSVYQQTHLSVSKPCLSWRSNHLYSYSLSSCCVIRDRRWLACVSASRMGCVSNLLPAVQLCHFLLRISPETTQWQIVVQGEDECFSF